MDFTELGISDALVRAVHAAGYKTPTEIQARAIPPALEGSDVIGRAQTGTGKTAAFALPILDRLGGRHPAPVESKRRRPREPQRHVSALIVTPTRELAHQIDEAFAEYGRYLNVKTLTLYGGTRIDPQLSKLAAKSVDVVVATPGRLLDHMRRRSLDLSRVEVFVLDEVDRMFDMGFVDDVREIVRVLPRERQTLLFSATISERVLALAQRIQVDPVRIEVGEQRNPIDTVTQHVYPTQRDRKLDLLRMLMEDENWDMALVFSGTKDAADYVTRRLQYYGIDATQLHSNLTQRERQSALEGFKSGQHRVLVATDIAARGLDIEGISHVVNYDVPRYAEDYIHRIGRTGRAEAKGDAITLVAYEEEEYLAKIETFIGQKFERKTYRDFDHGVVKLQKPAAVSRRKGKSRRPGKRRYV